MKKVFGFVALALALAACNKETDVQPIEKNEGITITAILAPKTAGTKAVADNGDNKITVTWAVDEHLAILYDKDGAQMADATITAVDGSGNATIEFTVVTGTTDDTPCTIIYPYSAAKDDKTGLKDAKTLLKNQDGTLSANLDVRLGAGKIQVSTPGLDVSTQPEAQFAIWKLTTSGDAKNLCILADNEVIASATLATEGTVFYVAVPAVSSKTVTAVANNTANDCYYNSKAGISLTAGMFYQSPMSALDDNYEKPAYKVTGNNDGYINAGQTLVLSGANMSGGNSVAFDQAGAATLIIMGTNTIAPTGPDASIRVSGAGTLTITGIGSLTVQGGEQAPGIVCNSSSSNILICGGTINAIGDVNSPGIGSYPYDSQCGTITITDGVTSVTATKGAGAIDCIGRGAGGGCGTVTIGGTVYWDGSAYQNGGGTYLTQSPLVYPAASNPTATPLTFEAKADGFTVKLTSDLSPLPSLQYRIDDGAWTTYTCNTATPSVNTGHTIAFRGNNTGFFYFDGVSLPRSSNFFCSNGCYLYGNVMSLLSADGYATATSVGELAFSCLFQYNHLYSHDTKELVLPATTLAAGCYSGMFYGCTALTRAPELPAMTLADDCYSAMFYGCEALTRAPELPATTLAGYCYKYMFGGCTAMTKAPILPATTLVDFCYESMFYNCSSLNNITCLATDITASDCTNNWLDGVAATGTFTAHDSSVGWTANSTSGIPSGWTRVNAE